MMRPSSSYCCCCSLIIILWGVLCLISVVYGEGRHVVKRDGRKEIVTTEYGTISSVDGIGIGGWESGRKKYHLQFMSLDPNSVFLPAILHAHLVFYVHTGSGKLSYSSLQGGGEVKEVRLRRGDVFSLESGTLFFIHSDLDESHRQRFRINAIFSNPDDQDNWVGPYSFIHHLFRGFDKSLLQAAFQVSEEVIEEITNGSCRTPPIVHAAAASKDETKIVDGIKRFVHVMDLHSYAQLDNNNNKKSTKTFNLFKEDPDVKNCNGWSTAVTSKHLPALKASNMGVFMVNLTTNAMMAPHWNPTATEIGMVLEGRGMVRVVCSSNLTSPVACNNTRFLVEEGDIFVIPRFHPMAHMSFNNETLVFMGFTTSHTNNHPQFLAGEASVLRALNKQMVQLAFNINSTTISKLLSARKGSTILDCVSCAEEEQEIDKREEKVRRGEEEEEERKQQEEEKQRKREKEEEERRCQEEEKRREEEERRRREEEEEHRCQEEEKRQEEEERRRREERRQQEEEEKRREEEEKRHQEEKEKRRREEEEEEDERKREEEEKRRRREEEEEDERRREEEGEEQKGHQEEKEKQRRREEEEEDERRRQEEEEQRRHQEEKERRRRREEEEERREKEEEEEDERRRQEEEEQRRHQDEKERRRRREEEEERREKEEEEEEDERGEEEEEERERGKEEQRGHREQEDRRRQREETEEEAARREEEERGRS